MCGCVIEFSVMVQGSGVCFKEVSLVSRFAVMIPRASNQFQKKRRADFEIVYNLIVTKISKIK